MGCSRSAIEPAICASDEEEFLKREDLRCQKIQEHMITTGQSSNNYGLFNYDSKTSNAYEGSVCSSGWIDEIPEIIGALMIIVVQTQMDGLQTPFGYQKGCDRPCGCPNCGINPCTERLFIPGQLICFLRCYFFGFCPLDWNIIFCFVHYFQLADNQTRDAATLIFNYFPCKRI